MSSPLAESVLPLLDAYRQGRSLAILLDYDGTLTPIVAHPRLAKLDRPTRRLLARLARHARVRVAVLSGRMLDDLRQMVHVPGLWLAGTAGLELDLGGQRITHPRGPWIRQWMLGLVHRLREAIGDCPGAWVENKRLGLTIHFRQTPGDRLPILLERAAEVLRPWAGQVRIFEGPMALEVLAAAGWDKGTAVRMILRHMEPQPVLAFYAGDGANDADAMDAVNGCGGLTVGVGPHAPEAACFRLPDCASLKALLTTLLVHLEEIASPAQAETLTPAALQGLWSLPPGIRFS